MLLWLGYATLHAALGGLAFSVMAYAFVQYRRTRRLARDHLCYRCAYPVDHATICPECGSQVLHSESRRRRVKQARVRLLLSVAIVFIGGHVWWLVVPRTFPDFLTSLPTLALAASAGRAPDRQGISRYDDAITLEWRRRTLTDHDGMSAKALRAFIGGWLDRQMTGGTLFKVRGSLTNDAQPLQVLLVNTTSPFLCYLTRYDIVLSDRTVYSWIVRPEWYKHTVLAPGPDRDAGDIVLSVSASDLLCTGNDKWVIPLSVRATHHVLDGDESRSVTFTNQFDVPVSLNDAAAETKQGN